MIRLSIQARQALARLTLPVLIVASFGIMLLGKADALLAERARMALADGLAPIYAALAAPLAHFHATVTETADAVGHARGKRPAARLKTRNCGAGSRSRWHWMRKTSG